MWLVDVLVVAAVGVLFWLWRSSLADMSNRLYDLEQKWLTHVWSHAQPEGTVVVKSGTLVLSEPNARGYDILSSEDVVINPGEQVSVKTDLITKMQNCDAICIDKSGYAKNFRVSRRAGLIDEDYSDPWEILMVNEGREPFIIKVGQKLCNVVFLPKFDVDVSASGDGKVIIKEKKREGGWGSTSSMG